MTHTEVLPLEFADRAHPPEELSGVRGLRAAERNGGGAAGKESSGPVWLGSKAKELS